MFVSPKSNLNQIIEKEFFSKALEGKENEDKAQMERKISLHKSKISELERGLGQVVSNIATEIGNINRELGTGVQEYEMSSILQEILENLKSSAK